MKQYLLYLILVVPGSTYLSAQSLEIMPGTENIFVDLQWLKRFEAQPSISIFSRTRATVDYENQTDLFSGAYLNYTTKSGIGGSLVGSIAESGASGAVGPHFFKGSKQWLIFLLFTVNMDNELGYSGFSIIRFRPEIGKNWKLYTNLELFSAFQRSMHAFSVQRIRLGLDRSNFQFGLASNLSGAGAAYLLGTSWGAFIRREFR